jgi:hypothetical protein
MQTNCGVQNFMLMHGVTPDLLIIQDRSGSMMDPPDMTSTASKWSQMTAAIEAVVQNISTIHWGLMMFPDASQSGGGIFGGGNACAVPAMPDVAPGAGTAPMIVSALMAASPGGSTPTAAAINGAVSWFGAQTGPDAHNPQYLLLATDGQPNCGAGGNIGDDSPAAEAAVSAAAAAGINTFVVGIGSDTGADATLTQMAINGKEPNMTAGQKPYYSVSTTMDLENVLNTIAGQIVSCTYMLQTAPTSPDLVDILDENGNKIPRDQSHANGWDYGPGDMSIIFYGAACTALQMGVTTSISAIYGCPPVN